MDDGGGSRVPVLSSRELESLGRMCYAMGLDVDVDVSVRTVFEDDSGSKFEEFEG